eukprot:gene4613-17230_t
MPYSPKSRRRGDGSSVKGEKRLSTNPIFRVFVVAAVVLLVVVFRGGKSSNSVRGLKNGGTNEQENNGDYLDMGNQMLQKAENSLAGLQEGFAPAPPAVDNSAQLRADAEKELDSVLLQIEKRRRDLEHIESDVNVAKEKQHKADDELKDAKEVLSKLRDEASKLEVHHKKMKIKQKRVEKQVQKAENVENEKSEKEKVEASIKLYSFNEYKSSLLPLDREIPDIRIQECKGLEWDVAAMPKTSIIICFVDESWSALLRSIWSVLNRSPHELITEILLIDDGSSAAWLGGTFPKLLDYIATEFPDDVSIKVHSSPKRLGLIRARLFGAGFAKGEVLTFLDSHIECNQHWLEPILDVIGKSRYGR